MAFRQQQRPQSSRQLSYHVTAVPAAEVGTASSPQAKRHLEESEEWVLFSPTAPSTTARTHTTSTERTPRTAGLSHLSDFGSLDTAARSEQDDDNITYLETEEGEELDSLDDGLHAFHEPSEYAGPSARIEQSGDTVLPTHDGLGTFQPNTDVQEHMWQFERAAPRRRQVRRRSSVQRRFDALEETDEVSQEQERRQRIERWRLEQSKALLEEIERETRRRRRMSMVSAARSRADSAHQDVGSAVSHVPRSLSDGHSESSSDESIEDLSFWQRLTRRVIRDLMGIDEDTLSVIFGESLPEEAMATPTDSFETRRRPSIDAALASMDLPDDDWQHRLLERVARELGILVHQLSEHPGAFSTYRLTQEPPAYAGLPTTTARSSTSLAADLDPSSAPPTTSEPSASAHFTPTFPVSQSSAAYTYNESSLWGIEEEPESADPLDSFRTPHHTAAPINHAEETAREQEYWERELDVKMVFNFLLERFSSRRPSASTHQSRRPSFSADTEHSSARRAAIIRHNHPLVNQQGQSSGQQPLPTSSGISNKRERKEATVYKTYYNPSQKPGLRGQVLRSSSSCASQSTKKSRRSSGSGRAAAGRNYWDMSGSVGSGSVIAGEV